MGTYLRSRFQPVEADYDPVYVEPNTAYIAKLRQLLRVCKESQRDFFEGMLDASIAVPHRYPTAKQRYWIDYYFGKDH